MSGSFNPSADAAISMTAGSAGAAGTGAHTIAVLWKSDPLNANAALVGGYASGTQVRQFLADSGELFGTGDFSSGYPSGGVVVDTWYVGAISKPAGSAHYRIHLWPYAAAGTGTMDHGEAPDAANHGDGSSLTEIRIGLNDVRGNGLIAVVGVWDVELSDGQLDTLKSPNLSAWAALSPKELISLENWNGSTGATAVVGTSTQSSITGSVGTGANPPSFDFSVSAAPASPSGVKSMPPHLFRYLAARNQAMWNAGAGITAQESSGASSATARTETDAVGAKGAVGGGSASVRPSVQPAGGKVATGATSVSARTADAPSGRKGAAGVSTSTARAVDAPAGRKGGVGAASVVTRTVDAPAGRKGASGAATVAQRVNAAPTSSPSAATQATIRTATAPTGSKGAAGAVAVMARVEILVAGTAGPPRPDVVAGHRPIVSSSTARANVAGGPARRNVSTSVERLA